MLILNVRSQEMSVISQAINPLLPLLRAIVLLLPIRIDVHEIAISLSRHWRICRTDSLETGEY